MGLTFLQVSSCISIFYNFLSYSSWNKGFFIISPTENTLLGPFHLFSEPVLARGIIGIGLFPRKSWNIVGNRSGFTGQIWSQQMQSMQVGWLEPTENIVNENYLLLIPLGLGCLETKTEQNPTKKWDWKQTTLIKFWHHIMQHKSLRFCWLLLNNSQILRNICPQIKIILQNRPSIGSKWDWCWTIWTKFENSNPVLSAKKQIKIQQKHDFVEFSGF